MNLRFRDQGQGAFVEFPESSPKGTKALHHNKASHNRHNTETLKA